ncbi:unnamed protein product [Mytilus coruscus]|uniref:Uncharacterized protein n=1 Tax=Mytilus coruscus TaxID=42192 RepID=A0A6J8ASS0_MYTCO|nr:unnamed protein product [Mytilus coruscus]
MDSEIESMCKRMTADRIKRLLNVLQGEESEINGDEVDEQNKNKDKMASFSEVVTGKHQINLNETSQNTDSDPGNFVKPIFFKDEDVHGSGCGIQGLFREFLKINGKLTACQNGDRVVISKVLDKTVPRNLQIGKYMARVFHTGQPEFNRSIKYDSNSNDNKTKEHISETADKQALNTSILKPSHTSNISSKSSSTKTGPAKNVQMSNVNNTGQDKSQQSIDKFVNTPKNSRKTAARDHTPPTPTENIGPKKSKA